MKKRKPSTRTSARRARRSETQHPHLTAAPYPPSSRTERATRARIRDPASHTCPAPYVGAALSFPEVTLDRVCEAFIALGCEIRRSEEWRGPVTFLDVGALVYFLKAVPWVIKCFDVRRRHDVLRALHRDRLEGRPLTFTYSRFLIEVVKG